MRRYYIKEAATTSSGDDCMTRRMFEGGYSDDSYYSDDGHSDGGYTHYPKISNPIVVATPGGGVSSLSFDVEVKLTVARHQVRWCKL